MKKLSFLLAIILSLTSYSQTRLDSLHGVWLDESRADTVRFEAFQNLIWAGYLFSNPDTAGVLAEQLEEVAIEKKDRKWQAIAKNIQGISRAIRGQYHEALENYQTAMTIYEELHFDEGIAQTLNSMGLAYQGLGETPKAIECFSRCIEIHEKMKNFKALANPLNNLGLIYKAQDKNIEALEYFNKSFELHEQFGNKRGMANTSINKGQINYRLNKVSDALEEYEKSFSLFAEIDDKWGMSNVCMNLGETYSDQGNYQEALKYINQSLELENETGNREGEASSLNGIANIYRKIGKTQEAEVYAKRSLELAIETGAITWIKYAARTLKEVYKDQNKGMKALEMYELQVQMQDSIKSEEAKKGILKMEVQHEFEKKQLLAEQEAEEQARIEAEKVSRRNSMQYSGIGIGIFLLFGLIFLAGNLSLPKWAVELSVFLPFLIFFEFLLVLTDPFIDTWTGGEPLLKLLINALMAGAIFPLHAFFERTLKRRLFKAG